MSDRLTHDLGDLVGLIRDLRTRVNELEAVTSVAPVGNWRFEETDAGDLQVVCVPTGQVTTIATRSA